MESVFEKLQSYVREEWQSLHMPGHKSGDCLPPEIRAAFGKQVFAYDITEVEGADNLQFPKGVIRETEERIAEFTGAHRAHLLVNGSTCGLLAGIFALAREKEIFVAENCHQAVYHALTLAHARPVFLKTDKDPETGIQLGVSPETLQAAMEAYPQCKNLVITSPNYYGIRYHLPEILETAKSGGLRVLVDEAHGAHFSFIPHRLKNAISLGADLAVQSWHKNLPVLNQGSVLLVSESMRELDVRSAINLFQTTSPSYLIMASIDGAFSWMKGKRLSLAVAGEALESFYREQSFRNLVIRQDLPWEKDPWKLWITSPKILEPAVRRILMETFHIQPEMLDQQQVLGMMPLFPTADLLLQLTEALHVLDDALDNLPLAEGKDPGKTHKKLPPFREPALSPWEVLNLPVRMVPLAQAAGKVSARKVVKYPPGIPLLFPGEVITEEMVCDLEIHALHYNVQQGIAIIDTGESNV